MPMMNTGGRKRETMRAVCPLRVQTTMSEAATSIESAQVASSRDAVPSGFCPSISKSNQYANEREERK